MIVPEELPDGVREPLACEFLYHWRVSRNGIERRPVRVILDFQDSAVRFIRCHSRHRDGFWAKFFRPVDEYFECPFQDVLDVYEWKENKGPYKLVMITAHGEARVVARGLFIEEPANYQELKRRLSQLAKRTSSPSFQQTKAGRRKRNVMIGCAVLAVIFLSYLVAVFFAVLKEL